VEASALPGSVGLARPRIGLGVSLLRLRSDEQLVSLFRGGHEEAFRVIHDRYRQRLHAYSRQMLAGSIADAEDVVQEIFVRAYGGLRSSDRELALRAWLYRIAHNRCIDEVRRPHPIATEAIEELTATPGCDPVARVEQRDVLRRLIADVRRLPEQQRSALLMRELGGVTSLRGARVLDCGAGFGAFAAYLSLDRDAPLVTAVEMRPEFAALAKRVAAQTGLGDGISYEVGDMRSLDGIADASFDVVVVNNSFIYLTSKRDMQRAVAEGRSSAEFACMAAKIRAGEAAGKVADIAVIVVPADDGVKPQTQEAVDHAKDAGVPILVAVNKIDKEGAQPDRVRTEMTALGLQPVEWGGDTEFVDVSARTKEGLDNMLETIIVMAEVEELRANPDAPASGTVIESKLDPGRGPVVTILISRGTLEVGDALVAGAQWGRVRAMHDYLGNRIAQALPGEPVEVLGFDGVPEAGEHVRAVEHERRGEIAADA